jgi:hypothetical protein
LLPLQFDALLQVLKPLIPDAPADFTQPQPSNAGTLAAVIRTGAASATPRH